MNKAKIDIPVLLIFFNRPTKIAEVFEAVKNARPTRLYLYQDGVRSNRPDDILAVEKCREIVSKVDWDCTVKTMYQDKNYGCDPSEYLAQRWFFDNEEYGIVLEDDDVPSQTFFPFAKELLERYRYDNRIAIICGMNNYDVTKEVDESYFFSKHGSIWGWASWRRFVDLWDEEYAWIQDEEKMRRVEDFCDETINFKKVMQSVIAHKNTGRAHYETILFAAVAMNNMLNIVPKYNMIKNIGVDEESTHSVSDIRLLCKRTQKLFLKKTYEIDFPLVHPIDVSQNRRFDRKYIRTPFQLFYDRIETGIRRVIFTGKISK